MCVAWFYIGFLVEHHFSLLASITDEESVAMEEVKALGEAVREVELSIQSADVDAALDSYSLIHDRDSFSGRRR